MTVPNVAGNWIGSINGTNFGSVALAIQQDGQRIHGIASIGEPNQGQYQYNINGTANSELIFQLTPGLNPSGLRLGIVQVRCTSISDTSMSGQWQSNVGTSGSFNATKSTPLVKQSGPAKDNSVFIVHGHDDVAKLSLARFLEKLGTNPIILQEQPNKGRTILEKFEAHASGATFAVVLMTPDDIGFPVGKEDSKKPRPRQNVILELGYFAGKIGRDKTLVLTKGDIEIPSDVLGLAYEPMDKSDGWKLRLAKELKEAGFHIDLNKALS